MSNDDIKDAPPKDPKQYQHFKLVSEGGTHLAKSPGGGGPGEGQCLNTIEVLKNCATDVRKADYRATTPSC